VIKDDEILYPYIQRPDVFVVMSSEGYSMYRDELKDDGILIYEKDLVHAELKEGQPAFGIPSTRLAENLGRTLVQNIVMLGFLTAVTKIVPVESMREAVKSSVPSGTEELNLKAFEAGWTYFQENYAKQEPREQEMEDVGAAPAAGA
jgi:2-oxoglutarate ferredoxin oxidoreductase subunit gamma